MAVMTIKSVTNPASGIPAAPTLATVDVILKNIIGKYNKIPWGNKPDQNVITKIKIQAFVLS